ncbi:MAG: Trk system potassium transporter TrkA [Bacteroidales bacterium]|nr:Trk system potassium transporter TrkA [Bacteroidales bacterium]
MRIVIAGAGEVGSHLAKLLSSEANDITVIDDDEKRLVTLAESADIVSVQGNPSSITVLQRAGVANADIFVAVSPAESQDVNVVSAILAKKLGSRRVTARINNEEYLTYDNRLIFTQMGIDLMFYPEKIAAQEICDMLRRNSTSDSMDFGRGKLQLSVFRIDEDSDLVDERIFDFSRRVSDDNLQFRIVAVSRNGSTFLPDGESKFKSRDTIFTITRREGVEILSRFFGRKEVAVRKVMILGGGTTAQMLAKSLSPEVEHIKIMDVDRARCLELSEKLPDNVMVVCGDGRNSDTLVDENIRQYDAFVAITGNTETNILACVAARKLGVGRTVAEVENLTYIHLAEDMGVDAVVNKKLITASRIYRLTLSDKVKAIKYMSGTDAEIMEFVVAPDSRITKAPLKDISFPSGAIIGGVIRGNDAFIAVGSTVIKAYDRVAVFASPEAAKSVDKLFK